MIRLEYNPQIGIDLNVAVVSGYYLKENVSSKYGVEFPICTCYACIRAIHNIFSSLLRRTQITRSVLRASGGAFFFGSSVVLNQAREKKFKKFTFKYDIGFSLFWKITILRIRNINDFERLTYYIIY